MNQRLCLFLVASLLTAGCATQPKAPEPTHAPHWSYGGEGGPSHWGTLAPEFAACAAGQQQSPIDLAAPASESLANPVFHYAPVAASIVNNGHTVQIDLQPGSALELDGKRFELAQFHFHAPSEHTLDQRAFPAELHLVHKNAEGRLAVVGLLIGAGAENSALAPVWNALPATAGPPVQLMSQLQPASLLPAVHTTYRYAGSLTTPPCSEGVTWLVMTEPITMSEAQLAALTKIIGANARPVQPLAGRPLVRDSSP